MPQYVLPGSNPGLLIRGNIDIDARIYVAVPVGGGKFASVRSTSWSFTQPDLGQRTGLTLPIAHVLVPEVIRRGHKWVAVSGRAALNHYLSTGRHLGWFNTGGNATRYATRLHEMQARAIKR